LGSAAQSTTIGRIEAQQKMVVSINGRFNRLTSHPSACSGSRAFSQIVESVLFAQRYRL